MTIQLYRGVMFILCRELQHWGAKFSSVCCPLRPGGTGSTGCTQQTPLCGSEGDCPPMAPCDSSQKDGGALHSIFRKLSQTGQACATCFVNCWPKQFSSQNTDKDRRCSWRPGPRKVNETCRFQVFEAGQVQESPTEAGWGQTQCWWTNVLVEAVRVGLMHLWVKNAGWRMYSWTGSMGETVC